MERAGKSRRFAGVTLIEMVIVISIVGILTIGSAQLIKNVVDLWFDAQYRQDNNAKISMALMRMAREIRQLKDLSSVYVATATQLRFVDIFDNTIEYRLSGSTVVRQLNGGSDNVLISGVEANGLTFTYYRSDNVVLTAPQVNPLATDIDRVLTAVSIRSGDQKKTLQAQVYVRNQK